MTRKKDSWVRRVQARGQQLTQPIANTARAILNVAVPLRVTLSDHLWRRVQDDEALQKSLKTRVQNLIADDLRDLGIPGHPEAELSGRFPGPGMLSVVAHGRRCHLPPERIEELVRQLTGEPVAALPAADPGRFVDVVAAVVREVVRGRPSALLGRGQALVYAASLPAPSAIAAPSDWPPSADVVQAMLGPLLDLRISVADKTTVSDVLARAQLRRQTEGVEELIARLRAPAVEICVNRTCLEEITLASGPDADAFIQLRDSLFQEIGVFFPDFRFVLVDELPAGQFTFRLNQLMTPPYRFDPSYRPENLAEGYDSLPYLVHMLGTELRRHAGAFFHSGQVDRQLSTLEIFYPNLVQLVRVELSLEQVASYLRALLDEGESIRNLEFILETVLRASCLSVEPGDAVVLDGRLPVDGGGLDRRHPQLVFSFLRLVKHRAGLRTGFATEHSLVVHPVSAEVEELLRRSLEGASASDGDLPAVVVDQIVNAVWAVGEGTAPSYPLLVSSIHLRRPLQRLLTPVAPHLRTVAIQEVPLALPMTRKSPVVLATVDHPNGGATSGSATRPG